MEVVRDAGPGRVLAAFVFSIPEAETVLPPAEDLDLTFLAGVFGVEFAEGAREDLDAVDCCRWELAREGLF